MFYLTVCHKCAERLRDVCYLVEASKPHTGRCAQCVLLNITTVTQYEVTPKNQLRRRKQSGQAPRDRRARGREPCRGESGGGRLVTDMPEAKP